jgi:hypothetical protein
MGRNARAARFSTKKRSPVAQQGDFERNVLCGFGATQAGVAFQRQFHLTEKMGLRFDPDSSTSSTPNFGNPNNNLTSLIATKCTSLHRARFWTPLQVFENGRKETSLDFVKAVEEYGAARETVPAEVFSNAI